MDRPEADSANMDILERPKDMDRSMDIMDRSEATSAYMNILDRPMNLLDTGI